ncbi:MAG TPA: hypothetical protein VMN81_07755 [Vicinamibacterales bacterium]|nr:hypothetical protein [Vicinamibacterales bacterium]
MSFVRMINYTEHLTGLMRDIVSRVPSLACIDLDRVLVFARLGRTHAEGAYASCHCLTLPESDPGYFFWKDRQTGQLTRRSEWFVTKSPLVEIAGRPINYLISFVLPRFSDQSLDRSRKRELYDEEPCWIAKLDTVVHELYHIDPEGCGLRRAVLPDGNMSSKLHGPTYYQDVARMVRQYLATKPNPELLEFLRYDFAGLTERYGGVVCTTFRNYPSFPQRYNETVRLEAETPKDVKIEPLKPYSQPTRYTEHDLAKRLFTPQTSRLAV